MGFLARKCGLAGRGEAFVCRFMYSTTAHHLDAHSLPLETGVRDSTRAKYRGRRWCESEQLPVLTSKATTASHPIVELDGVANILAPIFAPSFLRRSGHHLSGIPSAICSRYSQGPALSASPWEEVLEACQYMWSVC